MSNFWHYFGGTVIHPRGTFGQLINDPQHLTLGLTAVLVIGLLYTVTVAGLAAVGAKISAPAWLVIPADRYYFWEIFFALPVSILVWILAAGCAYLMSKPFGGDGTFEQTLAVLGFTIAIPMLVTWIPETIGTGLMLAGIMTHQGWIELTERSRFWHIFGIAYQLLALAWYLILFPVAITVAQRLLWIEGAVVGIATLAPAGLVMFIFIR